MPLPNISRRPESRYFADPRALIDALRTARESNRELLGIYHSHPRSAPEPSVTDLEEAYYPDTVSLIIGPTKDMEKGVGRIRGFLLGAGRFEPVPIEVIDH